jgi:hypothetical protein
MRIPTGLLGCRAVDIGICDVSVFYTGIWNQQAIIPLYKITYGLTWRVRAEEGYKKTHHLIRISVVLNSRTLST